MDQRPLPTLSPTLLMKLLMCDHEKFRTLTAFTKRNTNWSIAESYSVTDGTFILLPSNFHRVSYLNLEQFSYSSEELIPVDYSKDKIITEEIAEHHPLLEKPSGVSTKRINKILKHLTDSYYDMVRFVMDWEFQTVGIENLKPWNSFNFLRIVNYCLKLDFIEKVSFYKYKVIIQVLMSHSTDSRFIVDVYKKIAFSAHDGHGAFISELPHECVAFFVNHLKKVGTEYIESAAEWYVVEEMPILAILRGNREILKELRECDYPSALLPWGMTHKIAASVQSVWPRKKDGAQIRSFYSLEYFSIFTTFWGICTSLATNIDNVRACYEVIWQSIPSPYLPIEDIGVCFSRLSAKGSFLAIEHTKHQKVLEAFRTIFREDYSDVFSPRSLKHLSRCAVRLCCRSRKDIDSLLVPHHLKSYLSLEV